MSEMIDDVAPGAVEEPVAAAPECSVTFTLDEEFTGFRTHEEPPSEEGGEPVLAQSPCRDIKVTFTDGTVTHTRNVNVCYDAEGNYDEEATMVRIGEVARGVEQKIAAGVITGS